MSLARRFNAGKDERKDSRRVVTPEEGFNRRDATAQCFLAALPGVETPG